MGLREDPRLKQVDNLSLVFVVVVVCLHMCVCGGIVCATINMCKSQIRGQRCDSFVFFYHVGVRDYIQVAGIGGEHLTLKPSH